MTRILHRLAVPALLLATASCGGRASSASPGDARAGRLAPRAWEPTAAAPEFAAWATEGCGRAVAAKRECYETAFLAVLRAAGVSRAMEVLDLVVKEDADVGRESHVYAHGIGIASYAGAATVSQVYAQCTAAFQSGCYHGVIQAYFADSTGGGVTAERLNALCADWRGEEHDWIQFQCAHGIGHGLMAVRSHHLLRALDECDLLVDMLERQSCWGGAFMENVVNATTPHHQSVTRVADGQHEGHGGEAGHHEHGGGGEAFKALDPADPLYPCTIVEEQHQGTCYLMQTSPILYYNKGDFAGAARACEQAPAEHLRSCYLSLGRDAAAYAGNDDAKAVDLCRQAPAERLGRCVSGTAKNRVDVTADAADGFRFCLAVPAGDARQECFRAVGEEIAVLIAGTPARERACASAGDAYADACRLGAGVPIAPREDAP
jgi:hypothetical protein